MKIRSPEESVLIVNLNLAEMSDAQTDINGCSRSTGFFPDMWQWVFGPVSEVHWFPIHYPEADRP